MNKEVPNMKTRENVKTQRTLQVNNNETRWDRMDGEKKKT
jgi:hypothetical protein